MRGRPEGFDTVSLLGIRRVEILFIDALLVAGARENGYTGSRSVDVNGMCCIGLAEPTRAGNEGLPSSYLHTFRLAIETDLQPLVIPRICGNLASIQAKNVVDDGLLIGQNWSAQKQLQAGKDSMGMEAVTYDRL